MFKKASLLQYVIRSLVLVGIYVAAAKFGLSLAVSVPQVTAVWPPTGIALAALILLGEEYWLAIFIGAFLANVTTAEPAVTALGIAFGNSLEALVGAYLLRTIAGFKDSFARLRDVVAFICFGVLLGPAMSASIGVISLAATDVISWHIFGQTWLVWWIGDMMGALIIAPVLLAWSHRRYRMLIREKPMEAVVLTVLIFFVGLVVFSLPGQDSIVFPQLKFLIFPFLVWAAVVFSQIGVATSALLISGIAVLGTLTGHGPFVVDIQNESNLLILQVFMFVATLSSMLLASVIEERNRIRQAVTDSEERYRQLVELSPDAIYIQSEGRFEFLNTAAMKLFRVTTPEAIIGRPVLDLIHSDDVTRVGKRVQALLKEGKPAPMLEERILRMDGVPVLVEAAAVPFVYQGKPSAQVIMRDITARKESERRLRISMENLEREKAKAEALLDGIAEGVVAIDNSGRVIYTNKQAESLFGYEEKDLLGKVFNELVSAEDERGVPIPLDKRSLPIALLTGKRVFMSYYVVRRDHSKLPVSTKASPVILEGRVVGAIGTYRDITKDKETDRAKSEFVSLASHQLRSPLTAFKWVLELLKRERVPKKVAEKILYLSESNERLITLVNDLLSVSRAEAGSSLVKKRVADVKKLVADTIEVLRPDAEAKKVRIIMDTKIELVNSVIDPNLFAEAFKNILDNAIYYGPSGSDVVVKIEQKGINYVVSIHNGGPAIAPKDKAMLFTKFYRGTDATTKKPTGSGLGLFIAKTSVEENGGTIWYETDARKGTTFYFTVPITS